MSSKKQVRVSFKEKVIKLALKIPKGKVSTYGTINRAAGGHPMMAQSITKILGDAYFAGERRIPFHRIVYSNGKIWINDKYRKSRMELYKKEGIEIDERDRVKNFESKLFKFRLR